MLLTLRPELGKSLYEQIYLALKEEILQGHLQPGEKLPSKRGLAEQLQVSVITVENAYGQLQAEGYLQTRERRGYFVAQLDSMPGCPREKTETRAELPPPVYRMDFQSRNIRTEQFPFTVWARIMRSVLLQQDTKLLQPLRYNGVLQLRQAIAEDLRESRGIAADPQQVIVGAGTEYLQQLMIQLLGREKIYAVEDPGYPKTGWIYEKNGVSCRHIPLQGGALPVKFLLQEKVSVVHISPSHHFPTGTVMPIRQRQELLRWAGDDQERYIIEDDYDSEFRFVGRPIPALFSTDRQDKVIYMNTFSKTIAPSMRISYMILPWPLLDRFQKELSFYACTVPSFEQYTLAEFISGGYFQRHISRMKKLYRQQRDAVIAAIRQSRLSRRCTIREEDAGLHFLLELDTQIPDEELKKKALNRGIRLSFLSDYQRFAGPQSQHFLVICYSGIDTTLLPEILDELALLLDEK